MNLLLLAKDKHDRWRLSSVMCQMAYFATGEVSLSHVSHLKVGLFDNRFCLHLPDGHVLK